MIQNVSEYIKTNDVQQYLTYETLYRTRVYIVTIKLHTTLQKQNL